MLSLSASRLRLASVDQRTFISLLTKAGTGISQADVQGMWATISTLLTQASSTPPDFLPPAHALIAPRANPPPSKEIIQYLASLSTAAHQSATSLLCSSILAGQGSESDDFGDYALYAGQVVGSNGPTKQTAEKIMQALGLERWCDGDSRIELVTGNQSPLPAWLDSISAHQRDGSQDVLGHLKHLLGAMQDVFEFRIITTGNGGLVLHFLVGRAEGGWQGLGGASTWSEE